MEFFSLDMVSQSHLVETLLAMKPEVCDLFFYDLCNDLTWPPPPNTSQWYVDRRHQCRAIGFLLSRRLYARDGCPNFERLVFLGRDDSVLLEGDAVYVVNHQRYVLYRPMFKIFWFPGIGQTGYPTA